MLPLALRKPNRYWLAAMAAVLLAWALAYGAAQRQQSATLQALGRDIQVHALALRGATARHSYLPYTVAQHPLVQAVLRHPSPANVAAANHYLEDINRNAGSLALYAMDAHGRTLAASNWRSSQSFVGQDYGNRPYFLQALRGEQGRFYGVGKTTGEPGYFLSAPVRSAAPATPSAQAAQTLGVVAVKVDLRPLQTTWQNAAYPVLLTDAHGIVMLGSEPAWLYHATRPLDGAEQDWLARHSVYGTHPVNRQTLPWDVRPVPNDSAQGVEHGAIVQTALAGQVQQLLAVQDTLPELGWTLTVTHSAAVVQQAFYATATLTLLVAALLATAWRLVQTRRLQQYQAQQAQLQHVQRRAMLDEMASTLAHEINQPLLAIGAQASAALLWQEQGKTDALRESLQRIEEQKNRAATIVSRIRSHVKSQTAGAEVCTLRQLVDNVAGFLAPELRQHHTTLTCEVPTTLPPLRVDKVLMEQVLLNLLLNALQALQAQHGPPATQRWVGVRASSDGGEGSGHTLTVVVEDNGPGIAPAIAAQLFRQFVSTKPQGLGMGLSICRSIVEAHRGTLQFANRPEGGARFTLTLPAHTAAHTADHATDHATDHDPAPKP
ncbi:hypothetical protein KIK84_05255 [Curvibacter sp. CHRR-16]|uniref:ATP-binding protein n=1 Tax=Curvibacter sp. CHRR-16 TaxID=2835872 RepID=UPI001BDA56A2|nr:ATP-binding protein [Curvibacter sp. CHRR-16]MBT0569723.1 hypothetical protein [Curvibacter sp. CHRR-16]